MLVGIRFNKKERDKLNFLLERYKVSNKSKFIKSLIFTKMQPFLEQEEREILGQLYFELNAIGRNLNQLIKLRKIEIERVEEVLVDIKELTIDIRKLIK